MNKKRFAITLVLATLITNFISTSTYAANPAVTGVPSTNPDITSGINAINGIGSRGAEDSLNSFLNQTGLGVSGINSNGTGNQNPTAAGGTDSEISAVQKAGESGDDDPCYENAGPLGWVMCPVLKAVAGFVSTIYQDIIKNYLQVQAGKILESGGSTYTAWSSFRDIANIAFVIGLLAVIISQLTGYGIDNYGIKRMLPRLIVAAILVNLSFFICQIVVDLANVAGASIGGLLSPDTLGISPPKTAGSIDEDVYNVFLLLAGGAATYILIDIAAVLVTLPAVIMCLFAVISAAISVLFLWFILIARQAVVVILVIISPLALVAYLFPNTEHLAKRYIKIATGVLILYPLCEFVINGGQLAGVILADVGQSTGEDSLVLVAMIVQVAPFFAIPSLLKSSLAGVGNLGARISNIGNTARGRLDGFRKSDFVQDSLVTSANKNLDKKVDAIGRIANRPGGKLLAGALSRRQRRYIKREADTLGEQLSLKSAAARLQQQKDPRYQARAERAMEQQVLKENAENWASHYGEDMNVGLRQGDFAAAMKANQGDYRQQDSGQVEGLVNAYMKDRDYGGLQEALAYAKANGASDAAMARAAKAMMDDRNFGELKAKKPSLGEWAQNPSQNYSDSMRDNIAKFKPKDWASMDGDERGAAFAALDSLKYDSTDQSLGEKEREKAGKDYAAAVSSMHAAANNPLLRGEMTPATVTKYADYGTALQEGAGQDFTVNGSTQSTTTPTTSTPATSTPAQVVAAAPPVTDSSLDTIANLNNEHSGNQDGAPSAASVVVSGGESSTDGQSTKQIQARKINTAEAQRKTTQRNEQARNKAQRLDSPVQEAGVAALRSQLSQGATVNEHGLAITSGTSRSTLNSLKQNPAPPARRPVNRPPSRH